MDGFIKIKGIMDEYTALMDILIAFEKEKLEAVKKKKTSELDDFLKKEQAYLLQLRGLDGKREKLQKEYGFEGMTYRQLIDKAESDIKRELQESFTALSAKTNEFRNIVKTINSYIDIQLHTIDAVLEKMGAPAPSRTEQTGIYDRIKQGQDAASGELHRFKPTKA